MDTCDVVAAKIDISEVAARYCHFADHRNWEGIVSLFTEDAVFDASAVYHKVWTGHAQLREFFDNAPGAVAHHPAGVFTDVQDEANAISTVKILVFWHRQVFSVDYAWELVKVDAAWRIRRQTIEVIGHARWAESSTAP